MARNWKADIEAALTGAAELGKEIARPYLAGANAAFNQTMDKPADPVAGLDWADRQLSRFDREMSPEAQQSARDMVGAVATPMMDLYDAGFMGLNQIPLEKGVEAAKGAWNTLSDKGKAWFEIGSGVSDMANPILGAGVLAATRGGRGLTEVADALTDAGPKTRRASILADELQTIRNQRSAIQDYHNDVDFIQADTIDYTIDERLGKRQATGKYRGAPRNVTTPQKLGAMRKELTRLLDKGAPGRLWYDESTEAANQLTGGKTRDKHLYAGTTAITSRGASVKTNQGFGIKGSNRVQAGMPDVETGRFPVSQGEAIDTLASGKPYEGGPKETPFYEGLTIDERAEGIRPTNDLWMARAFDYTRKNPRYGKMQVEEYTDKKTGKTKKRETNVPEPEYILWGEGLSASQHRFMDNELNALVETANKAKIGGVDDWTPERVQAAIWVAKKAEMEGTDVDVASLNFKDELEDSTAYIRSETRPSTDLDHMKNITGTDMYDDLANSMLQNEAGQDRTALGIGLLTRKSVKGHGQYEGVTSPSTAVPVLAGTVTGGQTIDPASKALTDVFAAGRSITGGQETVGSTFLRQPDADIRDLQNYKPPTKRPKGELAPGNTPVYSPGDYVPQEKGNIQKNAAKVKLDSPPGKAEIEDMNERLQKQFGTDGIFALHSGNGFEILNTTGIGTKEFQAGLKKVLGKDAKPEFMLNTGGLKGNTYWEIEGGTPGYKPSVAMKQIDEAGLGGEALTRAEKAFMAEADTWNKMDAAIEKAYPEVGKRDAVLTLAREVLSTKGFQGLREAIKKGLLPAVLLSVLGQQGLPTSRQEQGTS